MADTVAPHSARFVFGAGRIVMLVSSVALSTFVMWWMTDAVAVDAEHKFVGAVLAVMSILAGFLLATMSLSIEPKLDAMLGTEQRRYQRDVVSAILLKQQVALMSFVLTIILGLFLYAPLPHAIEIWGTRLFLFTSTVSMIIALLLPGTFRRYQMERYDQFMKALDRR